MELPLISNKALGIVFLVVLVAVAGGAYYMRAQTPASPPPPPPIKATGVVRDYNVTISIRGFWDKGQPVTPPKFEANVGDTFKILVKATDVDHELVIDEYNIKKLVPKGQTVVIEFVADKPGMFTVYCDLPGHKFQEQTQLWVYSPAKLK